MSALLPTWGEMTTTSSIKWDRFLPFVAVCAGVGALVSSNRVAGALVGAGLGTGMGLFVNGLVVKNFQVKS